MVYFLWIIFDVAIALRWWTKVGVPSPYEVLAWAIGGSSLAVVAWIVDHHEGKTRQRETKDLKSNLETSNGKIDTLNAQLRETLAKQEGLITGGFRSLDELNARAAKINDPQLQKEINELKAELEKVKMGRDLKSAVNIVPSATESVSTKDKKEKQEAAQKLVEQIMSNRLDRYHLGGHPAHAQRVRYVQELQDIALGKK